VLDTGAGGRPAPTGCDRGAAPRVRSLAATIREPAPAGELRQPEERV